MNKQILKFMLMISPLLFLVGCGDDDDIQPGPTLAVSGAPVSALPGDAISFEVAVTAPNGGNQLLASVGATSIASIALNGATSSTQTINYTNTCGQLPGQQDLFRLRQQTAASLISNVSLVNDPINVFRATYTLKH